MNIKYFFLLFAFTLPSHASVNVTVFYSGKPAGALALPDDSRLSNLLYHDALPSDIYWRAAQITNPEHRHAAEQEKASLISELNSLQKTWHDMKREDLAASTQKLINDLNAIPLTGRFDIELDPALSRVIPKNNPLLKGDYSLFISPRDPHVYLMGLTSSHSSQVLYPGVGASEYWQGYHLMPGADPAFMYVIQPTAEVEYVPVAMWNKLHREPMAGATLFIGFDPDLLPAEHKNINERIAKLLTTRAPQ